MQTITYGWHEWPRRCQTGRRAQSGNTAPLSCASVCSPHRHTVTQPLNWFPPDIVTQPCSTVAWLQQPRRNHPRADVRWSRREVSLATARATARDTVLLAQAEATPLCTNIDSGPIGNRALYAWEAKEWDRFVHRFFRYYRLGLVALTDILCARWMPIAIGGGLIFFCRCLYDTRNNELLFTNNSLDNHTPDGYL